MNKILFIALLAVSAMMFACGSQDGSAPELKNSRLGLISPFDAIVAEFDSDIINLDSSNISVSQDMSIDSVKKNKVFFTGANTTLGGSPYFDDGVVIDSIVFKKVKNVDGYVRERAVLYFSTHRILDEEPNNTEADANDINTFLNTTAREVTFAGVIDKIIGTGESGFNIIDSDDIYKLNLKFGDIVSITAKNNTTPFKVRFYGDCVDQSRGCNDKTLDITQKSGVLQDTVKIGHFQPNDTFDTTVPFYIKVSDGNVGTPSNPYLITVKKVN